MKPLKQPAEGSMSFPPTPYTKMELMGGSNVEEASAAFTDIFKLYRDWYLRYFRRKRRNPEDAEDLLSVFFARLWHVRKSFQSMKRQPGMRRAFLTKIAKRLLLDLLRKIHAEKRDGRLTGSLEDLANEPVPAAQLSHHRSPAETAQCNDPAERERRDALMRKVIARLRQDFVAKKNGAIITSPGITMDDVFLALIPRIMDEDDDGDLAQAGEPPDKQVELTTDKVQPAKKTSARLAEELGVSADLLRTYQKRLREKWRDLLYREAGGRLDHPTSREIMQQLDDYVGGV